MLRNKLRKGARRIGGGVKRRLKRAISGNPSESVVGASGSTPASTPAAPPSPVSPFSEPVPLQAETAEAATAVLAEPPDDTVGAPLTTEQVLELFEDMVRPALQSDGGDIDLIKVEDNDVYVRLTGACRTCPSSTVTMKMGIERLLVEEFPQFRHLIQVA